MVNRLSNRFEILVFVQQCQNSEMNTDILQASKLSLKTVSLPIQP